MFDQSKTTLSHLSIRPINALSLLTASLALLALIVTLALLSPRVAAAGPSAPEVNAWHTCTVTETMAHENRVHVRCAAAAPNGVYYFAVATTDAARAARVISIGSTALVAGRTVAIMYETDTTANPAGCATGDCRLLRAIGIQ